MVWICYRYILSIWNWNLLCYVHVSTLEKSRRARPKPEVPALPPLIMLYFEGLLLPCSKDCSILWSTLRIPPTHCR